MFPFRSSERFSKCEGSKRLTKQKKRDTIKIFKKKDMKIREGGDGKPRLGKRRDVGHYFSREFRGGAPRQQTAAPNGFSLFVMRQLLVPPPPPERAAFPAGEWVRAEGGGGFNSRILQVAAATERKQPMKGARGAGGEQRCWIENVTAVCCRGRSGCLGGLPTLELFNCNAGMEILKSLPPPSQKCVFIPVPGLHRVE